MFRIGTGELILIFLIILLLFGATRLPQIARSIGKSLKEFKKGIKEAKEDIEEVKKDVEEATKDNEQKTENG
jgi:sec-independent protein translocase protein TatA